jgi:hypothetical protein
VALPEAFHNEQATSDMCKGLDKCPSPYSSFLAAALNVVQTFHCDDKKKGKRLSEFEGTEERRKRRKERMGG